jgi:hypothetical protein
VGSRGLVELLAVVVVAAAAACGGDGGGGTERDEADDSGCPIAPARVAELLGYDVSIDPAGASAASCRYLPAESVADDHPAANVLVVERELADGDPGESGYDAALSTVEAEVGPVDPLPDGAVDGAERGWVATLGRVVQVGAAADKRLVQVTVVDGALDAAAARAIALDLAEDALG